MTGSSWPLALFRTAAMCVALVTVTVLVTAVPASASAVVTVTENAMDYPYFNQPGYPGNDSQGVMATCVTGEEADCENPTGTYAFDWGYETTCPQSDPECMSNKLSIKIGSQTWGMSDPWGYSLRNCTSYVAWRLATLGIDPHEFEGLGNGGDWYAKSPPSRRSTEPAVGDAAVQPPTESNKFGHVAFVESVNSGGTITVSEYNYNENGAGDERTGTPAQLDLTDFVDFGVTSLQWTSTQTATPPGAAANPGVDYDSLACPSVSSCTAVGSYGDSSNNTQGLLLTSSGASWAAHKAPSPSGNPWNYIGEPDSLVACPSTAKCFAVNNYLLSGSGKSWRASEMPLPAKAQAESGLLTAISCPAITFCVAAGTYAGPVSSPNGLLVTMSGSTWKAVAAPLPANASEHIATLVAIACPSTISCTAVGSYTTRAGQTEGLIDTWSGQSWTATEEPLPSNASQNGDENISSLNAVACSSATSCTAVGNYATKTSAIPGLLVTGSGTSWTPTVAPIAAGGIQDPVTLTAVACPSGGECVAAGMHPDSAGALEGFFLTGSGSAWTAANAPQPGKANQNAEVYLDEIACATSYACAAVGYYQEPDGNTQGLVISGWGTDWTATEAQGPNAAKNPGTIMDGISCPTPLWCAAIGQYQTNNGAREGLLATGPA